MKREADVRAWCETVSQARLQAEVQICKNHHLFPKYAYQVKAQHFGYYMVDDIVAFHSWLAKYEIAEQLEHAKKNRPPFVARAGSGPQVPMGGDAPGAPAPEVPGHAPGPTSPPAAEGDQGREWDGWQDPPIPEASAPANASLGRSETIRYDAYWQQFRKPFPKPPVPSVAKPAPISQAQHSPTVKAQSYEEYWQRFKKPHELAEASPTSGVPTPRSTVSPNAEVAPTPSPRRLDPEG